jgi:hypothetical protein
MNGTPVGDQMVSKDEALRLGLAPDSMTIKHPVTGVEGFRVGMEVFHQLHCLNLLRQFSWKEYYSHTGGDVETDEEDLRGHVGEYSSLAFPLQTTSCATSLIKGPLLFKKKKKRK